MAYARLVGSYQSAADVPLLIDTGADITALPRDVVDTLGVTLDRPVELAGYDGAIQLAPVVRLAVEVFGFRFNGAYVLLTGDHGVVGRDILNLVALLLDGPKSAWSIAPSI